MHNISSPRTDDSGIEQEIKAKGLTAPRVTPADIETNIASEEYFTAAKVIWTGDMAPVQVRLQLIAAGVEIPNATDIAHS